MQISEIQRVALHGLNESPQGQNSAYGLSAMTGRSVSVRTLHSLATKGLVVSVNAPGNMVFPSIANFKITEKGRAQILVL